MFSCRLIRAKEFRDLQKENMSTRNANTILYYYHFIYQINQDMIPNTNCDPVMNSITISMITMPNAFGHELYRSYGDLSLTVSYIIITIYCIYTSPITDRHSFSNLTKNQLAHFLHTFIIAVTQSTTDWMNLHNIRVE